MTIAGPDWLRRPDLTLKGEPSPGHRFTLYWAGWWSPELEQKRIAKLYRDLENEGRSHIQKRLESRIIESTDKQRSTARLSEKDDEAARNALTASTTIPELSRRTSRQLLTRQRRLAQAHTNAWMRHASTTSPLAIGLGQEHPLENGFSFLSPYGLPYLPGSSVKGVLRSAAEELAVRDAASEWTIPLVWRLFGIDRFSAYLKTGNDQESTWRDDFSDHLTSLDLRDFEHLSRGDRTPTAQELLQQAREGRLAQSLQAGELAQLRLRGELKFWDVFFDTASLRVDVMNPHQGDYYQRALTPSEDGSPKPVFFLTVPPDAKSLFVATWRSSPERPSIDRWNELITEAWDHAIEWMGFGAKTAVGYGRFCEIVDSDSKESAAGSIPRKSQSEVSALSQRQRDLVLSMEQALNSGDLNAARSRAGEAFATLKDSGKEGEKQLAQILRNLYKSLNLWMSQDAAEREAPSKKHARKVVQLIRILGEE